MKFTRAIVMVPTIFVEFITFVFAFTIATSRKTQLLRRLSYVIALSLIACWLMRSILFPILFHHYFNVGVIYWIIYLGSPPLLIVLSMAVTAVWIGTLNGTKKWDPDNCCGGDPVKTLIFSCEDGSNCIGNQTWTFLPPPMTSAALEKIFHAFEYLKKQVGTHKDPF
jgi:hypothetical protein